VTATPSPPQRRLYVERVLELYRCVPGRDGVIRRCDRHLAGELHDRGVPLTIVRAALILTVARRTFRSTGAPSLAPIATLHYVKPVIEELLANPPQPGYLDYLRAKLSAVAPAFATAVDHRLP
jgi:hypothetical protein